MAKRLTSLLPRLILYIDFSLEWIQVNAGQVIYHQDDESDAIYIVLNGRLRAINENEDGSMRVVGEYGQGESVGELEVLTEVSIDMSPERTALTMFIVNSSSNLTCNSGY